MKKIVILLSLILAVTFTNAQNEYQNDEIQTIFSKNRSNGGYGAFTISYSEIGGRDALVTGGRGAFIFDHCLAIGLGGFGFVNNLDYHSYNNQNEYSLAGGYGGLFIEPIVAGRSPVHVSFPILIGMGGISLFENYGWDYWESDYPGPSFGNDVFFVIEPAVELEFNLARFFRLAATVSYRHTSEIELFETDENVLNGFNFGMTFKFGKF
jgi:hypothetical protein